MKCPHCDGILPFVLCPECNGEIAEKSLFCCWCGNPMKREEGEIDFSQRILCSDGNCIGVIDGEGICNVCKKPYVPAKGDG